MGIKLDLGSGLFDELTKGLTDMSDSFSSVMSKQFVRAAAYSPGMYSLERKDLDYWVNLNHVEAFDVSSDTTVCRMQMQHCSYFCFKEDLKNTSFSFVVEEGD